MITDSGSGPKQLDSLVQIGRNVRVQRRTRFKRATARDRVNTSLSNRFDRQGKTRCQGPGKIVLESSFLGYTRRNPFRAAAAACLFQTKWVHSAHHLDDKSIDIVWPLADKMRATGINVPIQIAFQ